MGLKNRKENETYWLQKTHLFKPDVFICSYCGHKENKALKICPSCGKEILKTKYEASWVDEAEILDVLLGDD